MYLIIIFGIIAVVLFFCYIQKNSEKIKLIKQDKIINSINSITNSISNSIIDDIKINLLEKEYNDEFLKNIELKLQIEINSKKKIELEIENQKLIKEIEYIKNLRLAKLRLFANKQSLLYSTIMRNSIINDAVN